MKKIIVVMFLILSVFCFPQEVIYNSTPVITWDESIMDADGYPYLPSDVIEYEVYMYDALLPAPADVDDPLMYYVGTTELTEFAFTYPYRSEWVMGARVKGTDGSGAVSYGPLSFSTQGQPVTKYGPFVFALKELTLPGLQGYEAK